MAGAASVQRRFGFLGPARRARERACSYFRKVDPRRAAGFGNSRKRRHPLPGRLHAGIAADSHHPPTHSSDKFRGLYTFPRRPRLLFDFLLRVPATAARGSSGSSGIDLPMAGFGFPYRLISAKDDVRANGFHVLLREFFRERNHAEGLQRPAKNHFGPLRRVPKSSRIAQVRQHASAYSNVSMARGAIPLVQGFSFL